MDRQISIDLLKEHVLLELKAKKLEQEFNILCSYIPIYQNTINNLYDKVLALTPDNFKQGNC